MGAGKASRIGQDKLAMPWGNTTILGHVLRTLNDSLELLTQEGWKAQLENQHKSPRINKSLTDESISKKSKVQGNKVKFEVMVIARKPMNDFYFEGSFDSSREYKFQWIQVSDSHPLADTIRRGLTDLQDTVEGICFIPGDQVGLEAHTLAQLTRFFLENAPDFLVPQVGGVIGSPVFFNVRYVPELLELQGEQGGKRVLECYRERWTTYPVKAEFLLDIDMKEEYEKYRPSSARSTDR